MLFTLFIQLFNFEKFLGNRKYAARRPCSTKLYSLQDVGWAEGLVTHFEPLASFLTTIQTFVPTQSQLRSQVLLGTCWVCLGCAHCFVQLSHWSSLGWAVTREVFSEVESSYLWAVTWEGVFRGRKLPSKGPKTGSFYTFLEVMPAPWSWLHVRVLLLAMNYF